MKQVGQWLKPQQLEKVAACSSAAAKAQLDIDPAQLRGLKAIKGMIPTLTTDECSSDGRQNF